MEEAAKSQLAATEKELQSKLAADEAVADSEQSAKLRRKAEAAAMNARYVIEEIPLVAEKAAKRAVGEVVAAAVAKMNQEARETADLAAKLQAEDVARAQEEAQTAALPFEQAKIRAAQNVISYAAQGQSLAHAVIQLKGKAMEIANQAELYQQRRNPVVAQQMLMRAHDLLDRALQLQDQAKANDKTANEINGQLGLYDLAANSASAYGAYRGNPGGLTDGLPALPAPLELPPAAPGPAPAPAAAAA